MITIPQAKITDREELPPVTLFTTVVEYNPNYDRGQQPSKAGIRERTRTG